MVKHRTALLTKKAQLSRYDTCIWKFTDLRRSIVPAQLHVLTLEVAALAVAVKVVHRTCLGQSKAFAPSAAEPIIPAQSSLWWRSSYTCIFNQRPSSLCYSPVFNQWIWNISQSVLHIAVNRRCQRVIIRLRSTPLPYHIRKVIEMQNGSCGKRNQSLVCAYIALESQNIRHPCNVEDITTGNSVQYKTLHTKCVISDTSTLHITGRQPK